MATSNTVKIGGGSQVVVTQIALGLMMLTWTAQPVPYDQAFEAIKAAFDYLPSGVKMFLNSGEFYDNNASTTNLDLVAAFFEKYPEFADKAFLSVKGGVAENTLVPDSSPENLRRSVDRINKSLRGFKKLDLFECARVDPKVSIEETIKTLAELRKEGKFDYIGVSETSAATLRRANSIHPIAAVEIEISPWSYEEETKNVIATAKELGVAVVAYSPLGRGFLTGQIKSRADLPAGDFRLHLARFSDENMVHNLKIVDELKAIADKKGITASQLCLAWVCALGSHILCIPGSSKKGRILENLAAANIALTTDEFETVNTAVAENGVVGGRYFGEDSIVHLWA